MSKFAVIKTGGKQYRVSEDDILEIEKLDGETGKKFVFNEVLMVADKDEIKVGAPFLENAVIEAEIVEQKKGEKIHGFKFKAKSRYRKRFGHRQQLTKVKILKIK